MKRANEAEENWTLDVYQYDIPGIANLAQARYRLLCAMDDGDYSVLQIDYLEACAKVIADIIDYQIDSLVDFHDSESDFHLQHDDDDP